MMRSAAGEMMRQQHRTAELVVIVVLLLIFISVAARRIWALRIVAEQTAVTQMVGTLRSAIGLQMMERMMHGGLGTIAAMDGADPMEYLEQPPTNYEHLQGPLAPEQMVPYRWYFDPSNGVLTYRVGNGDYLDTKLPGPPRIRFRLQLRYADRNGNGRYDPGVDSPEGLNLKPLEPYHWRNP